MADDRKDQNALDREARERAAKNGVVAPQFVDYAEALENYEKRDDVETLESRRRREGGAAFRDAEHVRKGEAAGVVTAGQAKGENVTTDEPPVVRSAPDSKSADDKK